MSENVRANLRQVARYPQEKKQTPSSKNSKSNTNKL